MKDCHEDVHISDFGKHYYCKTHLKFNRSLKLKGCNICANAVQKDFHNEAYCNKMNLNQICKSIELFLRIN